MLRKMLIIGAGGFGREMLQWVKDINAIRPSWEIKGFLDDNPRALDGVDCDYKIVGSVRDWQPAEDEDFVLAIGTPGVKEQIARTMKARKANFPSVVHPSATLTPFSHFGEGFVMFPQAKLSVNSCAGDFVTILSSGVGHDVRIGDYSTVSGMCSVLRNVTIGKRVFVSAGVSIAQNVAVGDDAYLGLGSVIIKDVRAGEKMFGNPARCMPA